MSEAIETEVVAQTETLATKLDLAELHRKLEQRIAELQVGLTGRIEGGKGEVVRWVFTCILGLGVSLFAAGAYVLNHWVK